MTRRVTCVFHAPVTFSRQKWPLKPSPRIGVRNGFIWPTRDINANSPHMHRSPPVRKTSRRIFVIGHFPFGDRPLGGFLPQFHGVRPSQALFTFPHSTSNRGSLKQSNPPLLRGFENGKPQSESLFFSGNLRSHEGAPVRKTRIITELGVPVQDAFDALLIMNLGRAGVSGEAKVGSNSESGTGLLSSPGTVGREESSESCPLCLLVGKKRPKHFKEKCFTF
jgi:hypothetical protein